MQAVIRPRRAGGAIDGVTFMTAVEPPATPEPARREGVLSLAGPAAATAPAVSQSPGGMRAFLRAPLAAAATTPPAAVATATAAVAAVAPPVASPVVPASADPATPPPAVRFAVVEAVEPPAPEAGPSDAPAAATGAGADTGDSEGADEAMRNVDDLPVRAATAARGQRLGAWVPSRGRARRMSRGSRGGGWRLCWQTCARGGGRGVRACACIWQRAVGCPLRAARTAATR